MTPQDICTAVQDMLDDPEGTYCDFDWCLAKIRRAYKWLYGKLRLTGYQFDERRVVLPGVPAGTRDLSQFQSEGQPLAGLIKPRTIEWKLPGQDDSYWRRADGPLDEVRDVPNPTTNLDSWSFVAWTVYTSFFSVPLDLRITGEFLWDELTAPDNTLQISTIADNALTYRTATEAAKARGNNTWFQQYGADADEAMEDLAIALTRADQSKTRRVGRMNRPAINPMFPNPHQ